MISEFLVLYGLLHETKNPLAPPSGVRAHGILGSTHGTPGAEELLTSC